MNAPHVVRVLTRLQTLYLTKDQEEHDRFKADLALAMSMPDVPLYTEEWATRRLADVPAARDVVGLEDVKTARIAAETELGNAKYAAPKAVKGG